jgi:hypothetical protein
MRKCVISLFACFTSVIYLFIFFYFFYICFKISMFGLVRRLWVGLELGAGNLAHRPRF